MRCRCAFPCVLVAERLVEDFAADIVTPITHRDYMSTYVKSESGWHGRGAMQAAVLLSGIALRAFLLFAFASNRPLLQSTVRSIVQIAIEKIRSSR